MTPRQIIARGVCCQNGPCHNEAVGCECGQLGSLQTPSLATADAILAALRGAGFTQPLPREATEAMVRAAYNESCRRSGTWAGVWGTMVAAAEAPDA